MLRCIEELADSHGERIMAKHKRDEFRETGSPRRVVDPAQLRVLTEAQAIADEWVTEERLNHVLQALQLTERRLAQTDIGPIVREMIQDVQKESGAEIVWSKDAFRAIGTRAALLVKRRMLAGGAA